MEIGGKGRRGKLKNGSGESHEQGEGLDGMEEEGEGGEDDRRRGGWELACDAVSEGEQEGARMTEHLGQS
jgi:hypothetical protein